MPCSMAFRPASSAATCAAYGVDFRDPLKPWLPDEDHAIVLPWASVIVIIVLLNEAFTWAVPDVMFLRSRLRSRGAAAAVLAMYSFPPVGSSRGRYFFLPAIGRAGPLRVRAFVWVR